MTGVCSSQVGNIYGFCLPSAAMMARILREVKVMITANQTHSTRSHLINPRRLEAGVPQGLKPAPFFALGGTAEAVPFPKPIL